MIKQIEELSEYYGKVLIPELREKADNSPHGKGVILTRPDHYETFNIHINMYIRFDDKYRIYSIDGNKCYSVYKGMYNRSSSVYDRKWSKKDIQYLKKFISSITQ